MVKASTTIQLCMARGPEGFRSAVGALVLLADVEMIESRGGEKRP